MNKFAQPGKFREAQSDFTTPENSGLRFLLNPIDLATAPTGPTLKHPVNLKVAEKWKRAREDARGWFSSRQNYKMGEVQSVAVQSDVWVINILCLDQEGKTTEETMSRALKKCGEMAKYEKASVHVSEEMFQLESFEAMATEHLINNGINIYVYRNKVKA